jgi:phage shock protein A
MKWRVVIVSVAIMLVGTTAVIMYFIPHAKASAYLNNTKLETQRLKTSFKNLSQTATGALFEKPDQPPSTVHKLLHDAKNSLDTTRNQLAQFNATKSALPQENHIILSSKYSHAKVISKEVDSMVSQTEEVLKEYEQLLTYLETAHTARAVLEKNIQQLNSYPNLNTLIGRQDITQTMEQELRAALYNLESAHTPSQYKDQQAAFMRTLHDAANGFNTLSRGLATAHDPTIYTGTAQIEAASTQYFAVDIDALYTTTITSPILSDVSELTEKLMQFE